MSEIVTLEDIAALRESVDIECKLARGAVGNGQLPRDVWETSSAFANSLDNAILLGLREQPDGIFDAGWHHQYRRS